MTLQGYFSDEWLRTEEGQTFTRKVIDCALDAQLMDKQELFVNALINGIRNKDTDEMEKLHKVLFDELARAARRTPRSTGS